MRIKLAITLMVLSVIYLIAVNIGQIALGFFFIILLSVVGFYIKKNINNLNILQFQLGSINADDFDILDKSSMEMRFILASIFTVLMSICINMILWWVFGRDFLTGEALKVRDIILFNYLEYLFFFGSALGSTFLFMKRRFVLAAAVFALGVAWVVFQKSFAEFLSLVGIDSLSELNGFDTAEAGFWLSTAGQIFQPNLKYKTFVFYILMSALLLVSFYRFFELPCWLRRYFNIICIGLSVALMGVPMYMTLKDPIFLFIDNSKSFIMTRDNFSGAHDLRVKAGDSPIDVLVYIGESTSIMNMSVYGYPRNTTPELDKISKEDDGLIKINNVLATHTHTAWSLLEALSIGFNENENYLPINYRKRVPIVNLLNEAGVKTTLISNQGSSGTWNQASTVIFGKAERHFSTESKFVGNNDYRLNRPWDHLLFQDYVVKAINIDRAQKNITFFHSYAGHGNYLENIPPEFRNKVDGFLESKPEAMLTGKLLGHLPNIDAYDSAIKYVDFSLSEAIKFVKKKKKSTVLVYFSDHGDSVYGGRGHDSTRFIHEMARVPFLVYFNESAKKNYKDLYVKYKKLALENNISTLAQLPNTIFDLVGVSIEGRDGVIFNTKAVVGEQANGYPIAIRELSNSISYVNIDNKEIVLPNAYHQKFIDVTDYATRYMSNSRMVADNDINICYHASNTFAKSLRGRLVANCLEADFTVEDNGNIYIYHPPLKNVGYMAEDFVLAAKGKSVWVDAKNAHIKKNCISLANFLIANKRLLSSILVEFPTGANEHASELGSCVQSLQHAGIRTSYYVPTELAVTCSKGLSSGLSFESQDVCMELYDDLNLAHKSRLYTDISFDYQGFDAVQSIGFLKGYSLNTWNVMPQNLRAISPNKFRNIILNNDDPNSP